jgi:hypothetical protein
VGANLQTEWLSADYHRRESLDGNRADGPSKVPVKRVEGLDPQLETDLPLSAFIRTKQLSKSRWRELSNLPWAEKRLLVCNPNPLDERSLPLETRGPLILLIKQ